MTGVLAWQRGDVDEGVAVLGCWAANDVEADWASLFAPGEGVAVRK